MKLLIHKSLFSWKITNDKGDTLAKVIDKKAVGPAKSILNKNGEIEYTTDVVYSKNQTESDRNFTYVIYKNGLRVASASLVGDEARANNNFSVKPPKIYQMQFQSSYGLLQMNRDENNGITLTKENEIIAKTSSLLTSTPKIFEVKDCDNIEFWAAVYVLMEYMIHEDDMMVV